MNTWLAILSISTLPVWALPIVTNDVISPAGRVFVEDFSRYREQVVSDRASALHIREQARGGRHSLAVSDVYGEVLWRGGINPRSAMPRDSVQSLVRQIQDQLNERQLSQALPSRSDQSGDGL